MKIDGMQIEAIMAEQQMTLTQLSAACGIAKQNISTIIRRGSCYPKTAGKIAVGRGVSVIDIAQKEAST